MSHSETFYNELKGHYNSDESNNSRYLSSPSPAMHSRRRPSNRLHDYDYSSPANSAYYRRSSSPLTSSSSPAPMTSPIRIHDNVKIVSRDAYESYHFYDSDSRFSRSNDRDNWRPKLPSFRSLFGNGEHNPAFLSLSPSPKTTLSPLNFPPPPIRAEGSWDRHPSSFGSRSLLVDNYDAGDTQSIQPHVQNSRIVLSDHIDTPIYSERKPRQFNPGSPIHPRHSSHQTPTRQKHLFLEADSSPNTPEETGAKFLSPVKGSPYPRCTYFLVSSERGRRSPEPQSTRCGLYQLAEIAEKARSDLPKQTALEQSEESIVDCSSSQFSSPVGYQSSLPPSSPPTSEAQLSPIVPVKSLSPPSTLPLADVMNLTVESRANDCIEAHKLLKPPFDTSSFLENNEEKITPITTPVTIVSIQDPEDLTLSHGVSAVTLSGNIDMDAESTQTLDMAESGSGSSQAQIPSSDEENVTHNESSTKDDQPPLDFPQAESIFPDSFSDVVSISMPTASLLGDSSENLESAAPNLDSKPVARQLPSKSKAKTKTSSSAPPIASSAPRVTVTVVKRMKPTSNTQHNVPKPLQGKGTSTSRKGSEKDAPGSAKGKDKDILKTKTSEVVNSHPVPPKRSRDSQVSGKDDMKGLEVPPKKKVKSAIEGTKSSSSLARAISASYEPLPTSVSQTSPTIPAKRKADDDGSSRMMHVAPTSSISSSSTLPPAVTPPSKTPKKQKVMVLELPIYPKRKPETPSRAPRDIVSHSEFDNTTWVDEHWADVLAAAYGSPGADLPSPAKAPLPAPRRTREVTPDLMSESDLTSDDDGEEQEEEDQRILHKIKSPRSIKRRIVESESEEDSDIEEIAARPHFSRRKIVDSSDEEVEEEEAGSDEEEEVSSSDDEANTRKKPPYPKSKTHFPPSSSLDLELVGIIIETMTLTRSSSHLASALYRTVRETRGGIFETILKANLAHFDTVTQKLRSQGLIGHGRASEAPTEHTSRKGRPKRGAIANEEGGVAGMSEADIMWVSEFERVMAESAAKCGMFGKVESSFRNNPRDLPLPFSSRFFYVPDCDPDTERAQLVRLTMPGSGKRSETMKYKQYYWKPVGK